MLVFCQSGCEAAGIAFVLVSFLPFLSMLFVGFGAITGNMKPAEKFFSFIFGVKAPKETGNGPKKSKKRA